MNEWLEVSVIVNGEMAEAVADVLARFTPNGVVIESGIKYLNADDPGTPLDQVHVRAYLTMDKDIEEKRRKVEEALWYLGCIQQLPPASFTPISDQNWMESWKKHYKPIPIGERLVIQPVWMDLPSVGRIPICINPGMAFGTGTHPTTQICLELLEKYSPVGGDVIDIGCGSGILSIAALKLGAVRVMAVDIDETAIEACRENAKLNDIGEELMVITGSINEIRVTSVPFNKAPLVLANILASTLIEMLPAGLTDLITNDGILILSGILKEQVVGVVSSAQACGVSLVEQRQKDDWVGLVFKWKLDPEKTFRGKIIH
jgi:ribosomal protein L11 methyltransferase